MMFGAIYIGLSGLDAYSRGLQQVSNNVTNLNTTGFKGTNVSFRSLYGHADQDGAAAGGRGGTGGHGVTLGDGTLDFQQGELRGTDRDLDLAVDGNGFLVLLDGATTLYARTGRFEVDQDGYVALQGTGRRLALLDATGRPVAASIEGRGTNPPEATTTIRFADNLSSGASSYTVGDLAVYDASGTRHDWTVTFAKAASDGTTTDGTTGWSVTVTDEQSRTIGTGTLSFTNGAVDSATAKLDVTDSATGLTVALDFSSGVTSFSAGTVSTLRAASVDGYGAGTLTGVAAQDDGHLHLSYSNGQSVDLGAIAIADVQNPEALAQRDGVFAAAGDGVTARALLLSTGDPRVGEIRSKRLEASNVDLSEQFGDLILIQRGFQAASQIVSVSNDMIQQLFGIRGQG